MRRGIHILSMVAASVVCGVVLTIGVAWGCLLWAPPVDARPKPQFMRGGHPVAESMSRFGEFDGYAVFEHRGAGWKLDHVLASRSRDRRTEPYKENSLTHVSAGWPWLCLEGERRTINAKTTDWQLAVLPSLPGANGMRGSHTPLQPRWPAFISNTAVFAAFALALVMFAMAGKRSYRRCRGRCVDCAYDLRALPSADGQIRCPECGKLVRRSVPIS
jgi:DNA-directed RNA polymerase subunit RPC12/RpoP